MHITTYMILQKESFFLREDTCRWQTCLTAVLQDTLSGCGFWTMAVLHNSPADRPLTTQETEPLADTERICQQSKHWVFCGRAQGLEHDPWNPITEQLTPWAAFPGTIIHSKSMQAKILLMPSPHISYLHLCISLHFYFKSHSPHSNSASFHSGWSSFFQPFSRQTVVDAVDALSLLLAVHLPVMPEAARQQKVRTTRLLVLPSSALLFSFCHHLQDLWNLLVIFS